ncbi:MAG TPA: malate synthase A [Gemmatimonadaceae bacterium]|nr:malate synthase A [Gemmatimonadaceae bacterium]
MPEAASLDRQIEPLAPRARVEESPTAVDGVTLRVPAGAAPERSDEILTPDALAFVARLTRRFRGDIAALLEARRVRRRRLAAGIERLDFLAETAAVRAGDWRVAPTPPDLRRRIVEITAPVDRKMMINAFNSGADAFMADLEDACSPTWHNLVQGQVNLFDAVRGTIAHHDPTSGKSYRLGDVRATLIVRPRGLHLEERHLHVDGRPAPGSLVDFGLHFFHNAKELLARGSGPYFYLPKLESHREARHWNRVFVEAQQALDVPVGSIRATVLIETLPAAFEMDEILYELREHMAGLNCGRWDYIFSYIKTRQHDPAALLPDRIAVTMTQPNMRAYTQLAIKTCHRRGAHAIGGMAAHIPVKEEEANRVAFEKVAEDKRREAGDGHDGTWVAHPGLVPVARAAFEAVTTADDQRERLREDVQVTAEDLLRTPEGPRTEEGLRLNVRVGIRYLAAWLDGAGAVPLYNLMEDAATAEISRAQVWQWLYHRAALDDGRVITRALVERVIVEEMQRIEREVGADAFAAGRYQEARALFFALCTDHRLADFLTVVAYDHLERETPAARDA